METFIIAKDMVKKVKRFNLTGRTIDFKIKPIPSNKEPVSWIKEAVNQVIQKGTEDLEPYDQVAFSFCSKDFKRGEGWVRFRPAEAVTYSDVWDVISSVYQSNSVGFSTETFCLSVTSVKIPVGKGNDSRARRYNSFEEECNARRGIVTIKNKDNLCLPRALSVGIAYAAKDPEYTKVRKDVKKLQEQRAIQLLQAADVTVPEEGCGILELEEFQRHLQDYKIVVYAYGSKGRDVIFMGTNEGPTINLLFHKRHYNVITSLTAAFACSYFCEECHVSYDHKNFHRCGGKCPCCQQSPPCPEKAKVRCNECRRFFKGQDCFNRHKKIGSLGKGSVCSQITRCEDCLKTLRSDRKHTCGEVFCKICQKHVPDDHLCFMQPNTRAPKIQETLFIFYDLETRQEKVLDDGSLLHEPNLCVFSSRCDNCIKEKTLYFCQKCGYRLIVYRENVIVNFMEYLIEARKKFKNVIVIAHNGQGFDHQFILNYILINTDLNPDLIMRGTKIIFMKIGNIKFLDSLNYFPMALAKLPKVFGLGDTFKKGYFPHLFNTAENSDYVGRLPSVEYYSPDSMKPEERTSFLKWYETHKHEEFNMRRDLEAYCISDVQILTSACLKFRELMLETGNVAPFAEACTLPSACNKVYRRNFLQPNTIGIIPRGGYRWRDTQSKIAVQWMVWLEHRRGISIVNAAKGKESLVRGVKVDGFCFDTKEIFEFHGCYFHGCETCFRHGRDVPLQDNLGETMNSRRESTRLKIERLKNFGYTVCEMWECEFRHMLRNDDELKTFVDGQTLVDFSPLDPRDSFYGGRTGNVVEYYKCKPGEKIKYIDVCSLYPWVCKYGKFPLGHPTVYVGKQCDEVNFTEINGIIKCTILPPKDLFHPVLPAKMNNKLMFVLCRVCGETTNQEECTHEDGQRALTGTWVIDEVNKALTLGYQMIQIYEIWSYKVVDQFNPTTGAGGLFTAMMNRFIKIKQQASGWPGHCTTQEERDRYIAAFLEREDVQLEFSEIIENPGLRSLAKLILNSFWGKLGQRENQPKTKIVRSPDEFYLMLVDPAIYVNAAIPINDDTLVVNYEYRHEVYNVLPTVNVVIAAYVTTQARLKLYSYLERLGNRVLYYDTDSVIYVSKKADYEPETGAFIGDMTNELEVYGVDSYITEFVSGGPKNYAYKVYSPHENEEKVVCKVKGISLDYDTSRIVNFTSIKDMVLKPALPLPILCANIKRTTQHEVITSIQKKHYRPNSLKRKFNEHHSSTPYGYKKIFHIHN